MTEMIKETKTTIISTSIAIIVTFTTIMTYIYIQISTAIEDVSPI